MLTLCQLNEVESNVHTILNNVKENWSKEIKSKLKRNKKEGKISGKALKEKSKMSPACFIRILTENKNSYWKFKSSKKQIKNTVENLALLFLQSATSTFMNLLIGSSKTLSSQKTNCCLTFVRKKALTWNKKNRKRSTGKTSSKKRKRFSLKLKRT